MNGIEVCEDKCKCGGSLRLHSYVFGQGTGADAQKFYIDCTKGCGRVSGWQVTPEMALAEFDKIG